MQMLVCYVVMVFLYVFWFNLLDFVAYIPFLGNYLKWVGVNLRWGSIISIFVFDWGFIDTIMGWGCNQDWGFNRANTVGKMAHRGVLGSNPGWVELWRFVTLKPLKLQQYILHFWKPLIFFYLDKRSQERSCMFSLWYAIVNTYRFTS